MGHRVLMMEDYPELRAAAREKLQQAIKDSMLPRECKIIAYERLINNRQYIDIAAAVHTDRTTAARRLKRSAPQIRATLDKLA